MAGASGGAFLVVKLAPGWRLAQDGSGFVAADGRTVTPSLPAGAWFSEALPLVGGGLPAEGEAELARFVHLHLPPGTDLDAIQTIAAAWVGVERVQRGT